jgi:hypothetical protein
MITSGIISVLEETITPANSAYHAGDVVGGRLEIGTLEGAGAAGGFLIVGIALVDDDNEGAALNLHLFDRAPTSIADHAAFAPTAADLAKRVRKVAITAGDYETINSLKVAYIEEVNTLIPSATVWAYLEAVATPTYAATKTLTLRLFVCS